MRPILPISIVLSILLAAPMGLSAQNRGGSDPGRANFQGNVDARRLPGPPPSRVIPSRPAADPVRILPPAAHLQRFPPPPSLPTFPATFTLNFPSLRDGYYGGDLFRDQAGQPALRTRANRRIERRAFQR